MPLFRINAYLGLGRDVKAFLNFEGGITRGPLPDSENPKKARNGKRKHQKKDRPENVGEGREGGPVVGALPDSLIIGAQKCGTTYLYRNLVEQHPFVQGALEKEVHFFDRGDRRGGERSYREHFPPRGRGKVVIEKSPSYMFFPNTAKEAHKVVPNAKLIVLLRNPVDRAYSHYHHSKKLGRETLSFEEALEREPQRIAVNPEEVAFRAFSYKAKGLYADQLAEWLRFFDREQMLVLKSEDMYENPREVFGTVQAFLGLPERDMVFGEAYRHKGRYVDPMAPETRRGLEEYFEPHNQRLYDYLGRDFGW